jgi:hypothetical protein
MPIEELELPSGANFNKTLWFYMRLVAMGKRLHPELVLVEQELVHHRRE